MKKELMLRLALAAVMVAPTAWAADTSPDNPGDGGVSKKIAIIASLPGDVDIGILPPPPGTEGVEWDAATSTLTWTGKREVGFAPARLPTTLTSNVQEREKVKVSLTGEPPELKSGDMKIPLKVTYGDTTLALNNYQEVTTGKPDLVIETGIAYDGGKGYKAGDYTGQINMSLIASS